MGSFNGRLRLLKYILPSWVSTVCQLFFIAFGFSVVARIAYVAVKMIRAVL